MKALLLLFYIQAFCLEPMHYKLTLDPIDVVIPCVPKDLDTLELCIQGIRKHCKQIRRVMVVSEERLTQSADWISETLFPFSKSDLLDEITQRHGKGFDYSSPRLGWIFQQLLKLYSPFSIPGISPNVLVLDADTIFLNHVEFMNERGEPYFDAANEYHESYFLHAARLLPELKRVSPSESGIVNHMLFQRPILEDLFGLIASQHKTDPWKAICRCIDPEEINRACMSEYEIYFNFVRLRTSQGKVRPLRSIGLLHLREIPYYQSRGYVYAFSHEWARKAFGGSATWKGPLL